MNGRPGDLSAGHGWAVALTQYLPGEWTAAQHPGWDDAGQLTRSGDGLHLVIQPAREKGRVQVSIRWPGESWRWRIPERQCTFADDRPVSAVAGHVTRSLVTEQTAQQLTDLQTKIAEAAERDRQEQRNIERLGHQGRPLHDGRLILTLPNPMVGRARCGHEHVDLELRQLSMEQAEEVLRVLREA